MHDKQLFQDLSREVIDKSRDVIYLLDGDLRIQYCNPAWDQFARQNAGERALAAQVQGARLFDFIPEALQAFYRTVFGACQQDRQPFAFDFECSSAGTYRLFRMQILPFREKAGAAVVNALRVEGPARDRATSDAPDPRYVRPDGLRTMCAHCRRTRRVDDATRWDWVPRYLADKSLRVSHGMCPTCADYHYGAVLGQLRARAAEPV